MLSLSPAVQPLMRGYVLSVSPISGDIFDGYNPFFMSCTVILSLPFKNLQFLL